MENILIYIPIICSIISVTISFLVFNKNKTKDNKENISEDVRRDTILSTKLDMVIAGNSDLKNEIRGINNKFDKVNERLIRVEESSKQAHKRLDTLVIKK